MGERWGREMGEKEGCTTTKARRKIFMSFSYCVVVNNNTGPS